MGRMQREWQVAGILALALVFVPTAMVQAASPEGAGVATAVTGEVTVSHSVSPAPQPLHFKDEVLYRDRINTAARSLARLLLGKKALVTVRELSELQLIDEAGTSTVHLVLGKIAIGVARQRMRPGEIVEIRTQNAVAAIRGTVVVAERLTPPGGSDLVTRLHVLSGYIDVTTPGNPGAPPLRLIAPSSLTVAGNTMDRPVPLTAAARAALLSDLQPTRPLPARVLGGLVRRELARATGLARIISGDRSGGGKPVDVKGPSADVQSSATPTDSAVTVGGSLRLSPTANGFVAQNDGTVGLHGGLVDAANHKITSSADFVIDTGKGQFIVTGPAAPLVSLTGGTEEPIQHSGGFLDLNVAAVTTARAGGVDMALLEASAPLLNLFGAGGSRRTASANAIDLTSKSKVTNAAAFVSDLPGGFRTTGSSRESRPPEGRWSRGKRGGSPKDR